MTIIIEAREALVNDGATDVLFAVPQGDAEVKKICSWFERNV